MPDPQKNVAFSFSIGLIDQTNRPEFKVNPTLTSGDFKVSINGGAFANLASLPTVSPAGGRMVLIALAQAEMNGDIIVIQCVDSDNEWDDVVISINTTVNTVDSPVSIAANAIQDSTFNRIRGTVQADAGNNTTTFKTNLSASVDGYYINMIVKLTSGTLIGQVQFVTAYVGATKIITVQQPFTSTPSPGDSFDLINF